MKEILDATAVACNTPCHIVELRIDYFERAHSIDAIIELLMLIKPQLKGRGSVSYTHLDVYKRQVLRGAKITCHISCSSKCL